MNLPRRSRRSFPVFLFAAVAMISCGAFAQTPAPPAVAPPTVVTQAVVPPVAPVLPAPVPAPVAVLPGTVVARRPEDETPATNGQPAPGLASRVTAMLAAARGTGLPVQQLAERDRTIVDLRAQLSTAQQQLSAANNELGTLRAERSEIENAMRGLEGQQRTVAETVATLGFEPTRLPAPQAAETMTSGADLYGEWQRLKKEDPSKAYAYAEKNKVALRAYAASQPQTI